MLPISHIERVDLSGTIAAELDAVAGDAGEKVIRLKTSIASGVEVDGDGRQLSLMIRNLLDNAVRYTARGGMIETTLENDNGNVVMTVADTGMGIPLEAQERIFERFYRVDRARSRDMGGTGLGLAIVKHAVESHGGKIELFSELGRGTRFTVTIPRSRTDGSDVRTVAG